MQNGGILLSPVKNDVLSLNFLETDDPNLVSLMSNNPNSKDQAYFTKQWQMLNCIFPIVSLIYRD